TNAQTCRSAPPGSLGFHPHRAFLGGPPGDVLVGLVRDRVLLGVGPYALVLLHDPAGGARGPSVRLLRSVGLLPAQPSVQGLVLVLLVGGHPVVLGRQRYVLGHGHLLRVLGPLGFWREVGEVGDALVLGGLVWFAVRRMLAHRCHLPLIG